MTTPTPAAQPSRAAARFSDAPAVRDRRDAFPDSVPHAEEARYRTLVRAISQIVWSTPPTGELLEVDPAWSEYTGQSAEEARGWGWLDIVHPEDKVRVRQLWKRAVETRSFYHIEHRLLRRDGVYRWVAARAAPVFGPDGAVVEWIGTYSDVDEIRRASEERARLFQAERRARADAERLSDELTDTLESISEPFCAFDGEWRLVRMNEATRRSLREAGVAPAQAIGRVLWDLLPELEHSRWGMELRRAARERTPTQFVEQSVLTGQWLETHVYPTRDGVASYALDVTERVRAEETLRFLAEASRVLASSLDYETTLQTVARLAVPFLADYCIVDLVEEDGVVRRIATAHVDPAKQPLLDEIRRYPPVLDSDHFVARVLRTGIPELAPSAEGLDMDASTAGRTRLLRIVEALEPRSYVCVPLLSSGSVVGSILCASASETRRYGHTELEIAEELARRAAVAVGHARLHEAERLARLAAERATHRLRAVQEISGDATAEPSLDAMLVTLVERVQRELQTGETCVLLPDARGDQLVVRASTRPERVAAVTAVGEGFAGRVAAVRAPRAVAGVSSEHASAEGVSPGIRSVVGVPLLASGRLVGVLQTGSADDREFGEEDVRLLELIAERVAHAIERAQLFESEQRARADAEAANRAKMDFLAMMSHELRTPLNAIAGYTELLELGLRGPVTEQQVKDLQAIRRNEHHLLALIEEVLSFAKLDAGRVELDMREVRVRAALESVLSMVGPQVEDQGHECAVDEVDPTLMINADLEKLQQILVNLLSNAIKFTEKGGRIRLTAESLGRAVAIRVTDTGIGIPPEQHQRIFEPFVQLDNGPSRRIQGTGLGLAISRELARAMHGELSVRSEPGGGAEFTLTIPRA